MFLNAKFEAPNISSQLMRSSISSISAAFMPAGERAADQAAHAGAGGHVDGDVMLLEPADDADVRDAAGAAAAERDADGGPRLLRGARDGEPASTRQTAASTVNFDGVTTAVEAKPGPSPPRGDGFRGPLFQRVTGAAIAAVRHEATGC